MHDKLDKKISDNKDYTIPKNVDLMIENTLSKIENNDSKNYIKAVAITGIMCVFLSGLGISVTASATGRSVKDVVYGLLGYEEEKDILENLYNEQIKDGISFALTSAAYNDSELIVSYSVKSKELIKWIKEYNGGNIYAKPDLYDEEVLINASTSIESSIISDEEIIGYFSIKTNEIKKLKSEGNKYLDFRVELENNDKVTTFKVDIPLTDEFFMEDSKTFEFENEISGENEENTVPSKLLRIVASPVHLTLEYDNYYMPNLSREEKQELISFDDETGEGKKRFISYAVFDYAGKELAFNNGGGSLEGSRAEYQINPLSKKFYIVPIMHYDYIQAMEKKINLKVENGKFIMDENEDFDITFDKLDNKIKINYKANTSYLGDPNIPYIERIKDGARYSMFDLNYDGDLSDEEYEKFGLNQKGYGKNLDKYNEYYNYYNKDLFIDGEYVIKYQSFEGTKILEDKIIEIDLSK